MITQTTVSTLGNSQGIRLNKSVLEAAQITISDILQVETAENTIILRKIPKHKSFLERLAEYNGQISICDFDWGEPQGRELV